MKKITGIFLFNVVILSLFITSIAHINNLSYGQSIPSDCVCNDPSICYSDNCSRKPKTDQNTFDQARYESICSQLAPWTYPNPPSINLQRYFCSQNQPDCCNDMKTYGDDRLCCYAERFFCHPSFCNGNGDNCGQYWKFVPGMTDRPEGYGCMKGPDANSMTPVYGSFPPDLPNATTPTTPPIQPTPTTIPTPTVSEIGCPTSSTNSYQTLAENLPNYPADDPEPNNHPDLNISLRGYDEGNAQLFILNNQPPTKKPPQLSTLYGQNNIPLLFHPYQVYEWNWTNNSKGQRITNPEITMLGLYGERGSKLYPPFSEYDIGEDLPVSTNPYQVFVLFADEDSITLKYDRNDTASTGFTLHIEDFCVDPNLISLYRSNQYNNSANRDTLIALRTRDSFGTLKTNEVKVAIRANGSFMDPRAKDWWIDVSSLPTPSVTRTQPTQTPMPTEPNQSTTPQPTPPLGAFAASCLTIQNTYKPTCPKSSGYTEDNGKCIDFPSNTSLPYPNANHHNLLLSGSVPANTDIYIVSCVQTPEGFRCTAGSNDNNVANNAVSEFAPAFINPLPSDIHQFAVLNNNPIRLNNESTTLSVIAHSYTVGKNINSASPGTVHHVFFALFKPPPIQAQPTNQPQHSSPTYGTWELGQVNMNECGGIMWDPKGRTFDAVSLEPISQADVTLFDVNKTFIQPLSNYYLGVTENPYITKLNGEFSFYVPNGIYYLTPNKPGYHYPLLLSDVHPNFTKAYWCDKDVGYPLYLNKYPIPEQNKLVHCDIPLKPIGQPVSNTPQLVSYEHFGLPGKTITKFAGLVTHPLTIVELVGSNSQKVIDKIQADKLGTWALYIDNTKIPQDETIKVKLTKVSLVSDNTEESIVIDSPEFQPIPRYIEGYVPSQNSINQQSMTQPSDSVLTSTIYPTNSTSPSGQSTPTNLSMPNADVYIQTGEDRVKVGTTDNKGYIVIYPEQLPIFDYKIVAIPRTPTVQSGMMSPIQTYPITISPLQFIIANKTYLAKNKINLLTAEKTGTKISHPLYSKFNTQKKPTPLLSGYQNISSNSKPTHQLDGKTINPPFILIFVLFLFTATGIGGMVFFVKNKLKK